MTPEGWTATTIGHHADVLTGFAFKSAEYTSGEQDVKLLRGDNIAPHRLRWRDVKRFPKERSPEVVRYQLQAGDFVVAMDRTWLPSGVKIAEVTEADLPCLLVQRVARLRAKDTLHQELMKQFFSGHQFDQHVLAVQTETAVPHISPADLRDYPIKLPPLPEQRRIAEILSTWDRAIETVEALIANARAQKKALMQSLLTGKQRLPGFSGEWRRMALGEIGAISSAGVDKKIVKGEAEVRLLNFLDAYNREFVYNKDLAHKVTAPKAKLQGCNVRVGDVFFTPSSETRDDIALAAVATEDMPGVVYSYHVVRFRPSKLLDLNFSAFLFQIDDFKRQAYRLGDGSGQRYVISQANFRKMEVSIPEIDEQAAIGSLLADYSITLAEYETQLAALRQEKSALMQQLLTGKRRVKVDIGEKTC